MSKVLAQGMCQAYANPHALTKKELLMCGQQLVWWWWAGLQLFHSSCGVAVPALTAGAVPEMLACLKTAGGAAVAAQRLTGMLQRFLHGRVVLFVGQLLARQPFGGGHQ